MFKEFPELSNILILIEKSKFFYPNQLLWDVDYTAVWSAVQVGFFFFFLSENADIDLQQHKVSLIVII